MPRYAVYCSNCEETTEVIHSIKEKPELLCKVCANQLQKLISKPDIHLKGDNWTGKLLKEKDLRLRRSHSLGKKQHLEHKSDKILPNVDGEVVSSWSEAKKLAKDKGYNTSSYDSMSNKK